MIEAHFLGGALYFLPKVWLSAAQVSTREVVARFVGLPIHVKRVLIFFS